MRNIEDQIEQTYMQRVSRVKQEVQDSMRVEMQNAHDEDQLYMSTQISNYRMRRLQQQKDLQRLKEMENKEQTEMTRRLMFERQAYMQTKERLEKLKKKIKRLNKKNRIEVKTQKKIDFLINQPFHKWTNSFARKSRLWDNKKQALLHESVDAKKKEKFSKSPQRCCGASPVNYGH